MDVIKRLWKSIKHFIYRYYYSLLLCLVSLWLGITLIEVGHPVIASTLVSFVIVKLSGVVTDNGTLKQVGIIGLNVLWAIFVFVFIFGYHPSVELTYQFPAVILILGVGIALRGRFDG